MKQRKKPKLNLAQEGGDNLNLKDHETTSQKT